MVMLVGLSVNFIVPVTPSLLNVAIATDISLVKKAEKQKQNVYSFKGHVIDLLIASYCFVTYLVQPLPK